MTHHHQKAKLKKLKNKEFLMSSLTKSLITYESINTTIKRSKALQRYVEPLITWAIKALDPQFTVHASRQIFSKLRDQRQVSKLVKTIAPRLKERKGLGGYTSVKRTHIRKSDATTMAQITILS